MAQLPLVNSRSVQASGQVPGYQNVQYDPDAFGAGIGRALKELGQTGQQLAQTERALQSDLKANSALEQVMKAKNELRPWLYDPTDGILAKTGGNAVGSGAQMKVVTDNIRKTFSESIQDPEVRQAFERRFAGEIEQSLDTAARHELAQVSNFKTETTQAVLAQGLTDAYNGYTDTTAFAKARDNVLTAIRANALGSPPEAVALAEEQAISQLHLAVIARWAEEDPFRADEYARENRDEISGKDHVAVAKLVEPAKQLRQAQEAVANALTGVGSVAATDLEQAVIATESSGNPAAESSVGASGLMQVMPETAREVASQLGITQLDGLSDDRVKSLMKTDPTLNRLLGRTYLNTQLKNFGGDLEVALVAYNAGPEAAKAFIRHNAGRGPGQRDYDVPGWKGVKNESEAYVQKVFGNLRGSGTGGTGPSGRMSEDNWTLRNFKPDDILASTEGGRWVDARAATALDQLADRMKLLYPTFVVKINEEKSSLGITQGRRRGTRDPKDLPPGSRKTSQHVHGAAFDIQHQGWTDEQKAAFLTNARALGFSGIGFYAGGHLHIDMGGERTWGPMPAWAKEAMQTPVGSGGDGGPTSQRVALGAGGTGQTTGAPGGFYKDTNAYDFDAARTQIMSIPDSGIRSLALQQIAIQESQAVAAKKAQDDRVQQSAWDVLAGGGSVNDLNPALLSQLGPAATNSLYAYENNRDSGKLPTDWKAFSDFKQLTDKEMVDLGSDIYSKYRPIMNDGEFKELLNLQSAARKALAGDAASINLMANTRTRSQITQDAINAMGWKTNNKGDSEKIANLEKTVDQFIRAEQTATGKELPPEKVQDIVDKLMLVDQSTWFATRRAKTMGTANAPAEEFIAASSWDDVQGDDQQTLVSNHMSFRGEAPSREKALDLYNSAMQVWLGAEPVIPEDDEQWLQESGSARYGRPLTDREMKDVYAGYLLRLLGSTVPGPRR